MKLVLTLFALSLAMAHAQELTCNMSEYKQADGLRAESSAGGLRITWTGDHGAQLRAEFAIRNGQPFIKELAIGANTLAHNLTPEFDVVSGRRRISEQQMAPLRAIKQLTPEVIAQQRWNAFWDAP